MVMALAKEAPAGLEMIEERAAEAAAMLRLLANERRLILLCMLIVEGEAHVGRLAERVGLSQPAVSQHLAKLREDGLVATRRAGTTIHYRIADPRVAQIIGTLKDIFCVDLVANGSPAGAALSGSPNPPARPPGPARLPPADAARNTRSGGG